MKTVTLTDTEILALRAVVHGCNTNRRLFGASFLRRNSDESGKEEMIKFSTAIESVSDLLDRLDELEEVNND